MIPSVHFVGYNCWTGAGVEEAFDAEDVFYWLNVFFGSRKDWVFFSLGIAGIGFVMAISFDT